MTQDLVNEHRASEMLSLSVKTLRKWREKGINLRFKKIGTKMVRYSIREIEKFLLDSDIKINMKKTGKENGY